MTLGAPSGPHGSKRLFPLPGSPLASEVGAPPAPPLSPEGAAPRQCRQVHAEVTQGGLSCYSLGVAYCSWSHHPFPLVPRGSSKFQVRQAAQRGGRENALSEGVKCRQQVGHMVWVREARLRPPTPLPAQRLSSDRSSVCCSHPGPAAGSWNQPLAWAPRRREVWPLDEGELCSQLSTAGEQSRARRDPPGTPTPPP